MPVWNAYNVFRRFCAFVIGMVFFLSGLLKLLDPVGAGLVVGEYYRFFHLGFLSVTAKCVGLVLAYLETVLGVALMSGLWRKVVSIVTLSFLGIFTIITVILLIANPVMDCGCFGEAIHLTHLQSFVKNIILLGLAVVAFVPGRLGKPRRRKYVAFGIVCAFVLGFGIYSMLYIPLVDFTDFRPGARLEAAAGDRGDSYSATFVYEKEGVEQEFALDDLPDSTWTYVRTQTVKTGQSDEVVTTLSFSDEAGDYADFLAAHGDVIVFSVYNVQGLNAKGWERIAGAVIAAQNAGYIPLVLAAADRVAVGSAIEAKVSGKGRKASDDFSGDGSGTSPGIDVGVILANLYTADYKTLLTMNRSNGGATYFKDGTLVTKWAFRALPSEEKLSNILATDMAETVVETTTRQHLVYEGLLVIAFGVLFFV